MFAIFGFYLKNEGNLYSCAFREVLMNTQGYEKLKLTIKC